MSNQAANQDTGFIWVPLRARQQLSVERVQQRLAELHPHFVAWESEQEAWQGLNEDLDEPSFTGADQAVLVQVSIKTMDFVTLRKAS